jgi:osmoprotectant transport system permease protein
LNADLARAGRVGALGLALAALALPEVAGALLPGAGVPASRLATLAIGHLALAVGALAGAGAVGVVLGVLATRRRGVALLPLIDALSAAAQAVPPIVVVALALPALGFGTGPTALALVGYCLLPVLRGTADALATVPAEVRGAARAMGMRPWQVLARVELPLALRPILGALRVSLTLAVATAAVGSLAGAATLGTPIITGLQTQNDLQVLQGASATAALAFLAEAGFLALTAMLPRDRGEP